MTNRQSCHEVPVEDCSPRTLRVCSLVPSFRTKEINEQQCSVVTNQKCSPVTRQVCKDVNTPRQSCSDRAEEVCENRSASVTKYVDEEECSNGGGRKCVPVTRQECTDVVEQVPRQTYEQECKTEYTEECSQPSGYGN